MRHCIFPKRKEENVLCSVYEWTAQKSLKTIILWDFSDMFFSTGHWICNFPQRNKENVSCFEWSQDKRLLTDFDTTDIVDLCTEDQSAEHVHKGIENPEDVGAIHLNRHSHNTCFTDWQLQQTEQNAKYLPSLHSYTGLSEKHWWLCLQLRENNLTSHHWHNTQALLIHTYSNPAIWSQRCTL